MTSDEKRSCATTVWSFTQNETKGAKGVNNGLALSWMLLLRHELPPMGRTEAMRLTAPV